MFKVKRFHKPADRLVNKKVWEAFVNVWNRCKKMFASYLSKKTARFSPARLRWILYIFFLICTGISIYIILSPFINATAPSRWQKQEIQAPSNVYEREKVIKYPDSAVSYKNYRHIEKFEKYLDSLCTTNTGKLLYDSLIKLHPGLIDSLARLKEIYHSQ